MCRLRKMRTPYKGVALFALGAVLALTSFGRTDDSQRIVKEAVVRSTLNQRGTKPFHLLATVSPSHARDRGSNRTGVVEIWWASPTQWKREVRSPEFHQIAIVDGGREWQKNEGDYFPEWLRELSVALIEPVPSLDKVLLQVKDSDVNKRMGMTHFGWMIMSTDGAVQKGMGASLAVTDKTGLLTYGSGLGWSGSYEDYKGFHSRMVAQTVSSGSPQVTAKISILEDLQNIPPDFFNARAKGGDAPLLRTELVEELSLRKNLLPMAPVAWPSLTNGPLEGAVTTKVVIDRMGRVREVGPIVSDNPGLSETAGKTIWSMQFSPYRKNGVAVQVVSRITLPFKTVRPAGMEAFDSARSYFEQGRSVSFPAAGHKREYVLRATFQVNMAKGTAEEGHYVDTWKSEDEWKREATIGNSRFVRAQHGEARYLLSEGPEAARLRTVLKVMEPIPAIDTFVESDWRIKRDTVDGVKTLRILAGYESPEGVLDPEHARAYWFDESGKLVKTYFQGIETQRLQFVDFGGTQVAHKIRVLQGDKLQTLITVTDLSIGGTIPENTFELPGHEWKRMFTDEPR
jgi:hypothetical protein